MISKICFVFFMMVAIDLVWALYTRALSHNKSMHASTFSAVIQALSGVLVLEYTHEPVLLLPACVGAFVGTWLATNSWVQNVVQRFYNRLVTH